MKTLINLIHRAIAKNRVCSLELQLEHQTHLLRTAPTISDFMPVYYARQETLRDLAAARAHYNGLLPVGQRKTWSAA